MAVGDHWTPLQRDSALLPDQMPDPVIWLSDVPEKCQVSGRVLDGEFVDGSVRTMGGRWGIMHPDVHKEHGCGLGTGRGQLYRVNAAGVWVKVEG